MSDYREDRSRELEKRINDLREEWASLSTKKTYAVMLGVLGVFVVVANIYESTGPTNPTLGAVGGGCILGGIIWFLDIRSKMNRVADSEMIASKALKELRGPASPS